MKIAIVHDDLLRRGGGEQVVLTMMKAFPEATLFTSAYHPDLTYPEFKIFRIRTSWFNRIARTEKILKRLFFPIGLLAMMTYKVKGFDVVLISGTYAGKYVRISPESKVFIYTYTPFRIAWNPESYEEYNKSKGLVRWLFNVVTSWLRKIDRKKAQRGDYFIGMTEETADRIRHAYFAKDVKIIHPPVKVQNFYVSDKTGDYYLLVSRLEFYKKVDLAIDAFNELGVKLIIVGNGSKKEALKERAKSNIEFRSGLSVKDIADLYANCKAFIFPQHEDYGITPLEANASGRPVIAYGAGGVLETQIPYRAPGEPFTSVFFPEQTTSSLIGAIKEFEKLTPDPVFIRKHAETFGETPFIAQLRDFINSKVKANGPDGTGR